MTLRTKTLTTIGLTLICVLAGIYATTRTILLNGYAQVEEQATQENVQRVLDAYGDELAKLDRNVSDWAAWDETYGFIDNRNPEYVDATLNDATLARIKLNLILYLRPSGELVFGKSLDLMTEQPIPIPQGILQHLAKSSLLLDHSDVLSSQLGLVLLPEGPMMLASRPILTSDGTGPIRGTLIMGRFFDQSLITQLGERTHFTLTAQSPDQASLPADFEAMRAAMGDARVTTYVRPLSADLIGGYTVLKDLYGTPALFLRIDVPRVIFKQGLVSMNYLLLSLLVVGVVSVAVTLLLLERLVLLRLARLSHAVSDIGNRGDLAVRLPVEGKDELTSLAGSINDMLTDLGRTQGERQESDARYRAVVEQASEGILLVDAETQHVLESNAAFQQLLGYTPFALHGLTLGQLFVAAQEHTGHDLRRIRDARQLIVGERQCLHRNRSVLDVEVSGSLLARDGRDVVCLVVHDLTERKRMEEERARLQSEQRFTSLIQNASDVMVIMDANGIIRYQSPAMERVLGYALDTWNGKHGFALVHPDDTMRANNLFAQTLDRPAMNFSTELRLRHADSSWRDFEVIGNNLLPDPTVGGIVATYRDITERKTFEQDLSHLAFHDPLTNLPNRARFMDRLEHALVRTERSNDSVAVLFMDLDNFKLINDSLGHTAGDQLLLQVAARVQSCIRPTDTAARLGGDEFTMLLEELKDVTDAIYIAERIADELRAPFVLDGHEVYTTASVGIAMNSAGQAARPDDLVRDADLAMYRAKSSGKAGYAVFDRSLNEQAVARFTLETDLRHGIERGELEVYYQPIIQLETGAMTELEALVRWHHPQRGLVSPADFIPVAEETSLIIAIGDWVLEEACRQAYAWQRAYPDTRPLVMSVNLSARQFQHPRLVQKVADTLARTGLDAGCLKLEITESMMMHDGEAAVATLRELKRLGLLLAIDDFGTGYCSLNYLKRFPVDTLKIDRSFINGLGHNPEDTAIVRAVVAFAKALTLSITSEGIETSDQLAQLTALACERGQGYLFARPMTAEKLGHMLQQDRHWPMAPAVMLDEIQNVLV